MRLDHYAADTHSQFGEDGLIAHIFSKIGEGNRICVEFGAADGTSCSNTKLLWQNGWTAMLIEGDPSLYQTLVETVGDRLNVHTVNAYLTPTGDSSIDFILPYRMFPQVDFMSIDVDGIDYQIWEAMTVVRPRVVCIEYNQSIPPHVAIHQQELTDVLGASAKALVDLATTKRYRLVGMNKANLFFVTAAEASPFNDYERDLLKLFPYEDLSYLATDYQSHAFAVGNPPWGITAVPYVGSVVGDEIHILGSVADMVKVFEREAGFPAVFIGQDWDVGPATPTDLGMQAYTRLFKSNYPLVILDVANQSDLDKCRWVERIGNNWGYTLRVIRKDLFVFNKVPS